MRDLGTGLESLARQSQARNRLLDITGILLFDGEHFVQTIEGPHEAISELFRQIMLDPRHKEVIPFGIAFLQERRFPDWQMHVFSIEESLKIAPNLGEFDFTEQRLFRVHKAAQTSLMSSR